MSSPATPVVPDPAWPQAGAPRVWLAIVGGLGVALAMASSGDAWNSAPDRQELEVREGLPPAPDFPALPGSADLRTLVPEALPGGARYARS